jgi:anti-sigma B factor antagonist
MAADKGCVVPIHGSVNVDTSSTMRHLISTALRTVPPVVTIDFSGVPYIDTSGLATLLEASRIARQQGTRLVVEGLRAQPRELLHFSQIDRLLEIGEPAPDEPPKVLR